MSKKLFGYLFIIALLLGSLLYLNTKVESPLLSFVNSLKISYHNSIQNIHEIFNQHFFQAQHIEKLQKKLQKFQNKQLQNRACHIQLHKLMRENNQTIAMNPKTSLIRAISYQKFGDFNRLWMEIPDYNSSKIYGLLYKNYVAGIVVPEQNRPLALLNSDVKSTYAVSIGQEHAPGIAHGNNDKNIIINFIPAWYTIHKGDEVSTSGLDRIFFPGLLVGKVLSITKEQGYQRAVVAPYYQAHEPLYFHIIRSVY